MSDKIDSSAVCKRTRSALRDLGDSHGAVHAGTVICGPND